MREIADSLIHFIGCGGVGMVGLAKIALEMGASVSGSDLRSNSNTRLLGKLGVAVSIGHEPPANDPSPPDLIVRSSAIANENPEFKYYVSRGAPSMRRGEFLAEIADMYETSVAVAGSHGKTSVTALLVHILKSAELSPGYMVGGQVAGWDAPASVGRDSTLFITESDESDGTQRYLSPDILLLINIEDDHSWSLGGVDRLFANFAELASKAHIVLAFDSETTRLVLKGNPRVRFLAFPGNSSNSLVGGEIRDFRKLNSAIAIEAAVLLGVARENALESVGSFPGVARRMTIHVNADDFLLVEDYAHHPTEVRSALSVI
ncbi:MAG: hypothetical protein KAG97_10290, partial [Victivallales bacterium]|nr:hypothetical protein [Victivallales bacterium]